MFFFLQNLIQSWKLWWPGTKLSQLTETKPKNKILSPTFSIHNTELEVLEPANRTVSRFFFGPDMIFDKNSSRKDAPMCTGDVSLSCSNPGRESALLLSQTRGQDTNTHIDMHTHTPLKMQVWGHLMWLSCEAKKGLFCLCPLSKPWGTWSSRFFIYLLFFFITSFL